MFYCITYLIKKKALLARSPFECGAQFHRSDRLKTGPGYYTLTVCEESTYRRDNGVFAISGKGLPGVMQDGAIVVRFPKPCGHVLGVRREVVLMACGVKCQTCLVLSCETLRLCSLRDHARKPFIHLFSSVDPTRKIARPKIEGLLPSTTYMIWTDHLSIKEMSF